jgi:uncharacterized protein YcgI (DUF1989 family)
LNNEIFIPGGEARAFVVEKDRVFRLAQVEGKQVADVILFNYHNLRERFHAGYTAWFNCIKGSGNVKKVTELFSPPPYENVLATIEMDTVGVHFPYIGVRCSRLIYKLRDDVDAPPHRTCQDNLAEAISSYGLKPDDVPDVFNVWMNVDIGPDGCFIHNKTLAAENDYIDMRPKIDLLVAVSACPNDTTALNEGKVKPLKVILL